MGLFGPPNVEKMKTKKDVKGLIKALSYQKNDSVRKSAALALAEIGDSEAIETLKNPQTIEWLIAILKDKDGSDDRLLAAKTLGKIGDSSAVEPLISALENDDLKFLAAEALGQVGDMRAVEPLIAALKDKSRDDVREAAAKSLGQIGDVRAVNPLITALKDKNMNVYNSAACALGRIGEPALDPVLATLKDKKWPVRSISVLALGCFNDLCVVEELLALLMNREDEEVYMLVGHGLHRLSMQNTGDTSILDRLLDMLNDKKNEWFLQQGAAIALGQMCDARAVKPLIDAALADWNHTAVRNGAAQALKTLAPTVDDHHRRLIDEAARTWTRKMGK